MTAPRGLTPLTLRSCGFLWLFDVEEHVFVRLPSRWPLDLVPPDEAWTEYSRLVIDQAASRFAILADCDGPPLVRGVVHIDPCGYCHGRRPVDRRTSAGGRVALVWRSASADG